MAALFSKVLAAKFSPQNKCYVPDGTVLFVRPRTNVPLKPYIAHHFVSVVDRLTWSRYGWVKSCEEAFSLEGFLESYLPNEPLSERGRHHIQVMLAAIANLAEDTAVASTYSQRGIEVREMAFEVHRVIFHRGTMHKHTG
jgi:hypothetical protein